MIDYNLITTDEKWYHIAEVALGYRNQDPKSLKNYIFAWKYENAFNDIYEEYDFFDDSHNYLLEITDPIMSRDHPDFKTKDGKTLELKVWKNWFNHDKEISQYHGADCVLIYSIEDRAFVVYNKADNYKTYQVISRFSMSDKLKNYENAIKEILENIV